jgi:iron complex outermembrane recepter protein
MKKILTLSVFLCTYAMVFSQFRLTGKVTDEQGEALSGAAIAIENTLISSITDESGNFNLGKLKKGNYKVVVSYIGYETLSQSVDLDRDMELLFKSKPSPVMGEEVMVTATRAGSKSPVTYSTVNKEMINQQNTGKDLPYILDLTPSFVTTSDAGTGVGYTGFRIRGTDMNRINVCINGIPYNDSESHSVYWVDVSDIAASTENIQVQRGVGTSTNGPAAFGATINLQTANSSSEPYTEIQSAYGTFNTMRNSVSVGTGLLKNKYSFDARLSEVKSDGYIDNSGTDLKSMFLSGSYRTGKSLFKVNLFSGTEKTQLAWDGVPKDSLDSHRTYNGLGNYTIDNGNVTKHYQNETDNYVQTHLQLLFTRQLTNNLMFNAALHYTKGKGYYEEYKQNQGFSAYGLGNAIIGKDTLSSSDFITRKWLDNDFYGLTYSLKYNNYRIESLLGGGWNQYIGDHYGKIIWSKYNGDQLMDNTWYDNTGNKKDFNIYYKINYQITNKLNFFGDLQYRHINYSIKGQHSDLRDITQTHQFNFFNPKFGLYYKPTVSQAFYFSWGIANREPNRDNYEQVDLGKRYPTSEKLYDYELGYHVNGTLASAGINLYYMNYKDQLVLTGAINDVGSAIMTNIPKSYRTGIEITGAFHISRFLEWNMNATFSRNKILHLTEYIDNWDYYTKADQPLQYTMYHNSADIAFSPSVIAGSQIVLQPLQKFKLAFISKYVGKQYIDNTSSDERMLNDYLLHDLRLSWCPSLKLSQHTEFFIMVNNILDKKYISNAWVYRYYEEGKENKEDGYFPQAGRHYMAGISLKF